MIRRAVAILIAAVFAWTGLVSSAPTFGAPATSVQNYAYGGHRHAAQVDDVATERGPPSADALGVPHATVDHGSRGTSARLRALMVPADTTYNHPGSLAYATLATSTTGRQSEMAGGDLSSLMRWHVAAKTGDEGLSAAYHYTRAQNVASIESKGLLKGGYATPDGSLSPLQAQIDLALPPNRGLPGALVRVDVAGLRSAGYEIPSVNQVGRSFGMPGGGYEMQFPYAIPPEFLKVIR